MKTYEIYMKTRNTYDGREVSETFYFKPMENGDYGLYDQSGELRFRHDLLFGAEPTAEEAENIAYHVCENEYAWDLHRYVVPVESYCKEVA